MTCPELPGVGWEGGVQTHWAETQAETVATAIRRQLSPRPCVPGAVPVGMGTVPSRHRSHPMRQVLSRSHFTERDRGKWRQTCCKAPGRTWQSLDSNPQRLVLQKGGGQEMCRVQPRTGRYEGAQDKVTAMNKAVFRTNTAGRRGSFRAEKRHAGRLTVRSGGPLGFWTLILFTETAGGPHFPTAVLPESPERSRPHMLALAAAREGRLVPASRWQRCPG